MKRKDPRRPWTFAIFGFILLLPALVPAPDAAERNILVEPESIHIGAFYSATVVEVSAEIPEGCDAVIEILGEEIEEQLLRKGRHWDIWMNVGEIDIEEAPSVYYAMSSDPKSLDESSPDPAFGYGALQRRAYFIGDVKGLKRLKIFDEFVKLKEREKLYHVYPGELELSSHPGGPVIVHGTFIIPSRIAPDTYQVRLSVLRDGRLVDSRTAPLEIRVVGLPASLFSLARRHGSVYGLLAVLVAAAFGYFTGVVFKRTKPDRRKRIRGETVIERNKGA